MICAVGEILVDRLVKKEGAVCHVGGAPFNVAVGAARCGASVAFWGKVGKDEMGDYLMRAASDYGVALHIAQDPAYPTTVAEVTLDEAGERYFRFIRDNAADYHLDAADWAVPQGATIVHLGTLMLNKREGRAFADRVVQLTRESGALLSVDANFRDDLFAATALRNEIMLPYLLAADILKMSEDEVCSLIGCDSLDEAVARLKYRGMLWVTAGSKPSRVYCGGHRVEAAPPKLTHIVDTTGAGDAFYGAVLAGLDAIYAKGAQPSMGDLEEILQVANRMGAIATQKEGAI
jgi:fructokinase